MYETIIETKIEDMLKKISAISGNIEKNELDTYLNQLQDMLQNISQDALEDRIEDKTEKMSEDTLEDVSEDMPKDMSEHASEEYWRLFWNGLWRLPNDQIRLSFGQECLQHLQKPIYVEQYLLVLKMTEQLGWSQKYYLLWQMTGLLFTSQKAHSSEIDRLMYEIYHQINVKFQSELGTLKWMGRAQRNQNLIFVTVQQFLDECHGPTKTVLNRAGVIKNRSHVQVMLINTAEQYGGEPVALRKPLVGTYNDKLLVQEKIIYDGKQYPFIQFDNDMPNVYNSKEFIAFVQKYRPAYIVNVGGNSILMDACAKMVPVLNINTVPSNVERTEATAQVIGRELHQADRELLSILHKSEKDVIVGSFTSSLKRQKYNFTRKELGIPEEKMAMVVIGARLSTEIDDAFCKMILPVLNEGACLVIVGIMNNYEQICERYPLIKMHSVFLGFQEDVLAILDCCDVYVNPKRVGGGTSVIEAMYKGLPVVTVSYGDVALGAGQDFCYQDYDQMQQALLRYNADTLFYKKMSQIAEKRAQEKLDSDSAFFKILDEFEERFCTV